METEPLGKRVKDRKFRRPDDFINIQVRIKGEFQRDLMQDGLAALVSQVPQPLLVAGLNDAVAVLRKLGQDVRQFGVVQQRGE